MQHISVIVSAIKFRLLRISLKTIDNLRCIFNTIFCLFSFQKNQANPLQSLLLYGKWEDRSASKSESEYSEYSSNTVDIRLCDEKDKEFIRTHSWVFRSKKKLLKFAILKRTMFSLQCSVYLHSQQDLYSTQFHRKHK